MPLDLLVPDLLSTPDIPSLLPELRLPALERWLARADRLRRPEKRVIALLASAFDLPSPPPVAAITLAADDMPRAGHWLRADPVYLHVGQDAVALHDPAILSITRDEANRLVAGLQAHFASDGLEFHAPAPDRWYVRVPEGELPRTVALDDAVGRNVFGMLPRGTGRINWPAALTEAQMLFSDHEVNARRQAEGSPAINSVWFWGEGALPERVAAPYALVYADDPFARGLALLSKTRAAPRPAKVTELDAVRDDQSVLVLLDDLGAPRRRGDEMQWKRAAARLDDDWFVELRTAIDRFGAVRVILPARNDCAVANLTSSARWRWFRSRQPLAAHA